MSLDLVDLITRVGFPVAVAAYLLMRLDTQVAQLLVKVRCLADAVERVERAVTRRSDAGGGGA